MNKKSYKRILALCFALMSSSSCSADKSHIQKSLLQDTYNQNAIPVKQIENRKSNGTQSGNLLLPLSFMGAFTLVSVGAARYSGLGPFADKPKKPDNPEIPGVPPKKPDNPEETPDETPAPDPFVPDTPEPGENSIAPVLSDEDIKIFKANFMAQREGREIPHNHVKCELNGGIPYGYDSEGTCMRSVGLSYDEWCSDATAEAAPEDYPDKVAAMLPLLGKKYHGSNSPNDLEITHYCQSIVRPNDCLSIFTIPDGPEEGTIWMIVDGITKMTLTQNETSSNLYLDPGQPKIVVKNDEKYLFCRFTDHLGWCDGNSGQWYKDIYRISQSGSEHIEGSVSKK